MIGNASRFTYSTYTPARTHLPPLSFPSQPFPFPFSVLHPDGSPLSTRRYIHVAAQNADRPRALPALAVIAAKAAPIAAKLLPFAAKAAPKLTKLTKLTKVC